MPLFSDNLMKIAGVFDEYSTVCTAMQTEQAGLMLLLKILS